MTINTERKNNTNNKSTISSVNKSFNKDKRKDNKEEIEIIDYIKNIITIQKYIRCF